MKKILVAVLALASVSAFANHKNLVSFDGDTLSHFAKYAMGDRDRKNSGSEVEYTALDFQVNYAWSVAPQLFVGGILGYSKTEIDSKPVSGATTTTKEAEFNYGVRAIYDLSTDHANAMYVSLSYVINSLKYTAPNAKEDTTSTTVEFGRRYSMFSLLAGPNVTYSPSISYTMVGEDDGHDTDGGSDIVLNLVKFDVLF
jgi:hypothetical protein